MSGDQWARLGWDAAALYDDVLEPGMFRPWAVALARFQVRRDVNPGVRVLDVATGTGAVARAARDAGATVTALDFSADMLARARSRTDAAGIEWIEADAQALPFDDDSFDLVMCAHGLQQLPDPVAAVAEAARVLVPGGRFSAVVWAELESHPPMHALVRALEEHVSAEAAENRRVPFSLGDADRLRVIVERGGLDDVVVQRMVTGTRFADVDMFTQAQLRATPLAAVGGIDDGKRAVVLASVREHLGMPAGGPLAVPMAGLMVTATAR